MCLDQFFFVCLTHSWLQKIRAIWYLTMRHLVRDIDAQKLGMVAIRYCVDAKIFDSSDAEYKRSASFLPGALPLKVMAYHFCYNNPMAIPVMSVTQMLIGMAWRVRFRAHYGKQDAILYHCRDEGLSHTSSRLFCGMYVLSHDLWNSQGSFAGEHDGWNTLFGRIPFGQRD